MERPSTGEREAATLYLTDLSVIKKNTNDNSDLLCFYAKVQTSHSKTRSAYTLMDLGASHGYIDSKYARNLGLPLRQAGQMSVITAGTQHPTTDRYQVWLEGRIRAITGNHATITGCYTLFDLKGGYDLIVGKNWHSETCHLVDSDNVLHLLDRDLSASGQPTFVSRISLKGLCPHQGRYREVHNHCAAVARAAHISLISADETRRLTMTKSSGDQIFVVDIRERAVGDKFGEDELILADLAK